MTAFCWTEGGKEGGDMGFAQQEVNIMKRRLLDLDPDRNLSPSVLCLALFQLHLVVVSIRTK